MQTTNNVTATQAIKYADIVKRCSLFFVQPNIRNGQGRDTVFLSDFARSMTVAMARRGGSRISETAALLGFSRTTVNGSYDIQTNKKTSKLPENGPYIVLNMCT